MKLAVAQFQPKDGDKAYNLSIIKSLCKKAKAQGAEVVSFHEMCITAYTFTKNLSRTELIEIAEEVPTGNSSQQLIQIAKEFDLIILAGLVEKSEDKIYNTYICVNKEGVISKFRKLHPFINPNIEPGAEYVLFDILGWKCSILICYDNNIIENVRAVTLMGAELIFAPHVTGCTPSHMPGRGFVPDHFWQNRHSDPVALRQEFNGPKGRGWLMHWLPSRAYDNGVFFAFTNPIGYDGIHLKNGNSMIIDPYGEILEEIQSFENEIITTYLDKDKIQKSGGFRYRNARRPDLYQHILGQPNHAVVETSWKKD